MKTAGRHQEKKLTAIAVSSKKAPGFYSDGHGLYLKVDMSGAKRWIQRIVINGKRCDIGLGSVSLVSLAEAREKALSNRKLAREGGDPLADKKRASEVMTFEQAAKAVHKSHQESWDNQKHIQQWMNTLTTYAFPHFGRKKMDAITSADVLAALAPIWTIKPETANRVRQRIGSVLSWGIAKEWRTDNPADNIASALPKRDKKKNVKHHKALPFQDVSGAIEKVRKSSASIVAKLALEALILTALRSGELRNGQWNEIDFDNKVWTVPAERMKQRKQHRVPLSPRCIEILKEAEKLKNDSGLIFPSATTGKALSDSTLSKLVRELKIKCVPHGFRASFRMWAGEKTNIPREVCEFALAHVVGDAAEQAYQRSDLFDKRRNLMNKWADYLSEKEGVVVSIKKGTA